MPPSKSTWILRPETMVSFSHVWPRQPASGSVEIFDETESGGRIVSPVHPHDSAFDLTAL
jgi:hypothetical protein